MQLYPLLLVKRDLIQLRQSLIFQHLPQSLSFIDNADLPRNKILIGGAHDHPTSNKSGEETQSAMSPKDQNTAKSLQIPIYGVDAMSGSGRAGRPANINRANPDGTTTNNVGKTAGSGKNINPTPFDIGRDALRIWVQVVHQKDNRL